MARYGFRRRRGGYSSGNASVKAKFDGNNGIPVIGHNVLAEAADEPRLITASAYANAQRKDELDAADREVRSQDLQRENTLKQQQFERRQAIDADYDNIKDTLNSADPADDGYEKIISNLPLGVESHPTLGKLFLRKGAERKAHVTGVVNAKKAKLSSNNKTFETWMKDNGKYLTPDEATEALQRFEANPMGSVSDVTDHYDESVAGGRANEFLLSSTEGLKEDAQTSLNNNKLANTAAIRQANTIKSEINAIQKRIGSANDDWAKLSDEEKKNTPRESFIEESLGDDAGRLTSLGTSLGEVDDVIAQTTQEIQNANANYNSAMEANRGAVKEKYKRDVMDSLIKNQSSVYELPKDPTDEDVAKHNQSAYLAASKSMKTYSNLYSISPIKDKVAPIVSYGSPSEEMSEEAVVFFHKNPREAVYSRNGKYTVNPTYNMDSEARKSAVNYAVLRDTWDKAAPADYRSARDYYKEESRKVFNTYVPDGLEDAFKKAMSGRLTSKDLDVFTNSADEEKIRELLIYTQDLYNSKSNDPFELKPESK